MDGGLDKNLVSQSVFSLCFGRVSEVNNQKIARQKNSVELNEIYYFNESTEDSCATRGLQSDYLKSIN